MNKTRLLLILVGLWTISVLIGASPAQAAGESISGTLKIAQNEEPIKGVTITVSSQDPPQVIDTVKSNAQGRFRIGVPNPGAYEVRIDPKTLPEGIELINAKSAVKTVVVNPGGRGIALFRLSNGGTLAHETTSPWLQLVVSGLRFGLIIAITSIGLSLIFGTTGLTNFSHGELVTVGAFVALWINSGLGAPLWLGAVIAIAVGLALGALNELVVWRQLRRRRSGLIAMLVVSIGLALVLRHIVLFLAGGGTQSYDVPAETEIDFGPVSIAPRDVVAALLCVIVLVAVGIMLQRTRIGTAMRAVADNRDLAAASGVNVNQIILVVWMLGGGLAALGGVLYGWTLDLRYDMGFTLLLIMFAGVTLGGLGNAYGALVGGVLIGLIVELSTQVIGDEMKTAAGLAVLIAVLLIRPSGLLGAKQRIG